MFLKITKVQLENCREELLNLTESYRSIIEFAATPLFDQSMIIPKGQRKKLEKIVNKLRVIVKKLEDTRKTLDEK